MTDTIVSLVSALRDELEQYGEMLALLDRQQHQVIARAADEVFQSIALVKTQGQAIQNARAHREDRRSQLAQDFLMSEETTFNELIPLMPRDYQPLVRALVNENNELLIRVRQRARQNHLLLSRTMELMQSLINTLFPGRETRVYNGQGNMMVRPTAPRSLYEAVG